MPTYHDRISTFARAYGASERTISGAQANFIYADSSSRSHQELHARLMNNIRDSQEQRVVELLRELGYSYQNFSQLAADLEELEELRASLE